MGNDHDLLIELRTEMKAVRSDIRELQVNVAARVTALEKEKMNKEDARKIFEALQKTDEDQGTRMRFVEKVVWGAIGIIGLLNFIGFAYIVSVLSHLP